ncbi:MAG: L-aspartate oxidase [Acidimicrobiia bacterium]|nr:L-aspartate oxidase [Acidimicrobiia bacterium]
MTGPLAVIIGSGIAGLSTALALGDCVVITKAALAGGSSRWAQGGVAAAIGADDDPHLHALDTIAVSAGLSDPAVAELVTGAAPDRLAWLIDIGARFDRSEDGSLILGREAGHSRHRIVHANGDATGAELMRTLSAAVLARPDIEVREHSHAVDLLRSGSSVVGVSVRHGDDPGEPLLAPAVVLATGGIGGLYAHTTNPPEVTGDGLAMAIRAGARIADPEFVQFHPTAMRSTLDPMPLLTEALRGAGAVLIDGAGGRFMVGEHPDAELAPRDVVARAIWRRLDAGDEPRLDATHIGASFPERFPTVYASAMRAGIDPATEPIPVSPAAHYHMGGVAVDGAGRSSLAGLYACGEASVTGLHGANRLASNSLLEGLVYGVRVADAIRLDRPRWPSGTIEVPAAGIDLTLDDDPVAVGCLRRLMWDHAGVMRTENGLRRAVAGIEALAPSVAVGVTGRNMVTVAGWVARAALGRRESRGAHHRLDFPEASTAWARHTLLEPVAERRHSLPAAVGAAR